MADTTKQDGGPAFPAAFTSHQPGMSLRAYAAINLRVPNSGIDWLDEMIKAARISDAAEGAMQGLLAFPGEVSLNGFHLACVEHAIKLQAAEGASAGGETTTGADHG